MLTGAMVLDRLAHLPALARLRALAHQREGGLWLVGGAVRDALLGVPVHDLDVAVDGDVRALARRLGRTLAHHDRFGTAEVLVEGMQVNLAATRTEIYPEPGALPEVTLGATIAQDLRRRDFTINALAVALDDGRMIGIPRARSDLRARRLRVLHARSFVDDPTRAYRLVRYAVRLDLAIEPRTERLARAADLSTLSDDRVAREVELMFAESDPVTVLLRAAELLGPDAVPPIDARLARAALRVLPPGRSRAVVLVASSQDFDVARAWALRLGWPKTVVHNVLRSTRAADVAAALRAAETPAQLAAVARAETPETVALAAGFSAARLVRRWFRQLREVRLTIDGADLLAAGVPQGPEVGRRLRRALDARLDGVIEADRDAELRVALEDAD